MQSPVFGLEALEFIPATEGCVVLPRCFGQFSGRHSRIRLACFAHELFRQLGRCTYRFGFTERFFVARAARPWAAVLRRVGWYASQERKSEATPFAYTREV